MTDDREVILGRVRRALEPLAARAPIPSPDPGIAILRKIVDGRDRVELLMERIRRVNGLAFASLPELVEHLRVNHWTRGYCDPELWPQLAAAFGSEFTVEREFDRTRVDDYAFGITRAAGGIAESGTIVLNDVTTSRRLAALAPWVHVAVVRRDTIFTDITEAIAGLGPDPNVIWCTGPSKTADVEGILIEGVHGPGVQIALVI